MWFYVVDHFPLNIAPAPSVPIYQCTHPRTVPLVVMGIPALFSEPDHLAQFSNKSQLFRLQNGSSFSTVSGFYNSAKLSNVLTYDRDAGSQSELGVLRESLYNDAILNAAQRSWFLYWFEWFYIITDSRLEHQHTVCQSSIIPYLARDSSHTECRFIPNQKMI